MPLFQPGRSAFLLCTYIYIYLFLFIYLAASGLRCVMWDLVPQPGIEPRPPALGAHSLSHWTAKEVLFILS